MDKYKLAKENYMNFCVTVLVAAAGVRCILAQTPFLLPVVSFRHEPSDVCLHFYSMPLPPPMFYCSVDGLTDEMEVAWLRNDAKIGQEEYMARNYTLLGNHTNGVYDLKVLRRITRQDDRSKYSCAVFLVSNSTEGVLLEQTQAAKLKVHFYVPEKKYPECSIQLALPSSSMPSTVTTAYKQGTGFTLVCCTETVIPNLKLVWTRENQKGVIQLAGTNASRKTAKDKDACFKYDITDHRSGDVYSCILTIPRVPDKTTCRRHPKVGSNLTTWHDEQTRKCSFKSRDVTLVQQNKDLKNDATFICYSEGAIEYLWEFSPDLDRSRNQYHVSEAGAVLLNLDSLSNTRYNITCTAVGEDSLGSRSLIVEISRPDATVQNIIQIVAISLGALVFLVLVLLIGYVVKTRLLTLCKDGHSPGLRSHEMRAQIQIRHAGNARGLYAFPSTRMASSSITPLMEGPEDTISTTEHERPPSPRPPRPGLFQPTTHLPVQGAVGGVILDEDEMVECQYRDEEEEEEEFECDPKSMNVEGLQYADLEFSEDEDCIKEQDDSDSDTGDEAKETKENGAPAGKPKIDYANIVHFDPRRNSDPHRNSDPRRNSESRWNSADPWRKNTNI